MAVYCLSGTTCIISSIAKLLVVFLILGKSSTLAQLHQKLNRSACYKCDKIKYKLCIYLVPEMTYYVSSGTLNPTHSLTPYYCVYLSRPHSVRLKSHPFSSDWVVHLCLLVLAAALFSLIWGRIICCPLCPFAVSMYVAVV